MKERYLLVVIMNWKTGSHSHYSKLNPLRVKRLVAEAFLTHGAT